MEALPRFRVAQTFTEPNGGRLTAAAFWFQNSPSAPVDGTYEFRVQPVDARTGLILNTILGVVERPSTSISNTTLSWVRFTFPVPIPLLRGRQYALVLTLINGTGNWRTVRQTSNDCPSEVCFTAMIPNAFTFVPDTTIPFQTFVTS